MNRIFPLGILGFFGNVVTIGRPRTNRVFWAEQLDRRGDPPAPLVVRRLLRVGKPAPPALRRDGGETRIAVEHNPKAKSPQGRPQIDTFVGAGL